jgi:anti-sigma factor RsiW
VNLAESHLAQEAVAALVDGELPAGAASRAARHLGSCLECRLAVEAQREAKEALHRCPDVGVPGALLSRLQAIPFTTDVHAADGPGTMSVGPGELTVSGASGSWSVDLQPRPAAPSDHGRWLRRGLAGTLIGLGAGVTALALNLPAGGGSGGGIPGTRPAAEATVPERHTEVVPPVVRAVTVGTQGTSSGQGGTP